MQHNKNINPNVTPPVPPPPTLSDNALTDADLQKIMILLQTNGIPHGRAKTPRTTKTYTGIAQEVNLKGHPVTYCWSHDLTRNLTHTKMGGIEEQVEIKRRVWILGNKRLTNNNKKLLSHYSKVLAQQQIYKKEI